MEYEGMFKKLFSFGKTKKDAQLKKRELSPIRKQIYDLTEQDLGEYPVWEFALDEEGLEGQDEATVRPMLFQGSLDPDGETFIVRSNFTLTDGTSFSGHLTMHPFETSDLGFVQPSIVTRGGQVQFWCGTIAPSSEQLAKFYKLLERIPSQVFPLKFESNAPLNSKPIRGTLEGFLILSDLKKQEVRVVKE
jgi:hypothetical protein